MNNLYFDLLNYLKDMEMAKKSDGKSRKVERIVICDHSSSECPDICHHKRPHKWDEYHIDSFLRVRCGYVGSPYQFEITECIKYNGERNLPPTLTIKQEKQDE